jgi:hypothetical protein
MLETSKRPKPPESSTETPSISPTDAESEKNEKRSAEADMFVNISIIASQLARAAASEAAAQIEEACSAFLAVNSVAFGEVSILQEKIKELEKEAELLRKTIVEGHLNVIYISLNEKKFPEKTQRSCFVLLTRCSVTKAIACSVLTSGNRHTCRFDNPTSVTPKHP